MITPLEEVKPPIEGTEIRILTPEEIETYVAPDYKATGNPLPNPDISQFMGVVIDGEVKLYLGLQLKLHAQPLKIEDGFARYLPELVKKTEEVILQRCGPQWVYLFAPAGRLAQIAQHMGMALEPWVILSKLVMPDLPGKPMDLPEVPILDEVEPEGVVQ